MSEENQEQWRARIVNVQRQRMTPEQLDRMKQIAERQSAAMKARATSYNMQKKSNGLRLKWATGVSALSEADNVASTLSASAYMERCKAAQEEMEEVSKEMDEVEGRVALTEYVALQNSERLVPDDHSFDEETGAREAEQEVRTALDQLKEIPESEQEQETKFKIYETFAERTEHIRKQLFAFVDEHKATLGARAAQEFQSRLEGIDSERNMGVADDAGEDVWFVYHMAVQVDRNVVLMNKVMADFDRKLALLASQTECPVCFEAFATEGDKRAEVLGCCHSVCKDCWAHIQQLARGRPLCPMCRYEDFYVAITGGGGES